MNERVQELIEKYAYNIAQRICDSIESGYAATVYAYDVEPIVNEGIVELFEEVESGE